MVIVFRFAGTVKHVVLMKGIMCPAISVPRLELFMNGYTTLSYVSSIVTISRDHISSGSYLVGLPVRDTASQPSSTASMTDVNALLVDQVSPDPKRIA